MRIAIDARMVLPAPTGIGRVTYNLIQALQAVDDVNSYLLLCRSETFAPIPHKPNFETESCDIGQYSPKIHTVIPKMVRTGEPISSSRRTSSRRFGCRARRW
jgi:hypothetical protein